MVEELIGCPDLAQYFITPCFRHMAVRAGGSDPGSVTVMNSLLEVLKDVLTHLMAGNTKRLRVGQLDGRIETAPEENAQTEACTKSDEW